MARISVCESNLTECKKKLEKIMRKMEKNNIPFSYKQVGEEFHTYFDNEEKRKITIKKILIDVEGTLVYNGWRVIAKLEHFREGNNFVECYAKPRGEVPSILYTMHSNCDHCNSKRFRRVTYILMNEKGNVKQVGSSCVKEFTNGLSLEAIANFYSYLHLEDEKEEKNYKGYSYEETRKLLGAALASYSFRGFFSVNSNEVSTKDDMMKYLDEDNGWDTEVDEIIEWGKGLVGNNSFNSKVREICNSPYTPSRLYGVLAAIPKCYESFKEIQKKIEMDERNKKSSTHKFVEGEKVEVTVTIKWIRTCEGYYGESCYIYELLEEDGTIYKVLTSSELPESETPVRVKGIVKKNDTYRGVKETVLKRVKII